MAGGDRGAVGIMAYPMWAAARARTREMADEHGARFKAEMLEFREIGSKPRAPDRPKCRLARDRLECLPDSRVE